jgi:hypothetical protein
MKIKNSVVAGLFTFVLGSAQAATPTTYLGQTERSSFSNDVGAQLVDGYDPSVYDIAWEMKSYSDEQMSSFFGETKYQATGQVSSYPNGLNLVGPGVTIHSPSAYCAGCNGSFMLDFTSTTLGNQNGVYGVGLDIMYAAYSPYHAFVTFGSGATADYLLPIYPYGYGVPLFWGVTSSDLIKTIHFGGANGAATTTGSLAIDNLTIAAAPVPEPETYAMLLSGIGLVGWTARLKKRARD